MEEEWWGRCRLLGIDVDCCTDAEGADMWSIAEMEAVAGTADLSNSVDVDSTMAGMELSSTSLVRVRWCGRRVSGTRA